MSGLSTSARRYILGLVLISALVSSWELSHLPEKSIYLFLFLLSQMIGAFFIKKRDPTERFRRIATYALSAIGMVILAWQLPQLREQNSWALLGIGSLAAAAHVLKQIGPTRRSSYQMSYMIYGLSLVLIGGPASVMIIIIAHTLEYAWGGYYPWYIQTFNIATFTLSASAAGLILDWTNPDPSILSPNGILGIVAAFIIFVFVNHLLIGLVLKVARDQNFIESGVFGFLTLMIDFGLLCMGAVTALLWRLNPYAVGLGLIPLYLVYSTLRVPALERQTETDPKTGIYNAKYFSDMLKHELIRAQRFDRPLTVVMADLDLLRNINNTYGHLAGDVVLRGIAQILNDLAGDYDIVARFGGEEFAILMPETTPDAAKPLVESMRRAIDQAEFPVATNEAPIKATMSFGIAGHEGSSESADALVHNADLALYQAKHNGRNQVVLFTRNKGGAIKPPSEANGTRTANLYTLTT